MQASTGSMQCISLRTVLGSSCTSGVCILSQVITCGIYFYCNNSVAICGKYVLKQAFIMVYVFPPIADTL